MAEQFLMKNPSTGIIKKTFIGYSWTMLFFNALAPLFRGDFLTFLILALVNIGVFLISPNAFVYSCIASLPAFIYSFFWNRNYTDRLLGKGYVFAESEERNVYAAMRLHKANIAGYILCVLVTICNLLLAFSYWNSNPATLNEILNESFPGASQSSSSTPEITGSGTGRYKEPVSVSNNNLNEPMSGKTEEIKKEAEERAIL